MTHIYLDAMGGDNAPVCTVEGALEALRADPEMKITLGGPRNEIEKLLSGAEDVLDRLDVDDCPEIITNHDAPVMAIRQKKGSAQVKGMLLVREGGADGFVSAPGRRWRAACSAWAAFPAWRGPPLRPCCPTEKASSA